MALGDLTATLTSRQIAIEDLTARLTDRQIALGEFTENLAESQSKVEREMADLRKTMLAVSNTQERTNGTMEILAQRHVITEQSLNALAVTVERHIADHD